MTNPWPVLMVIVFGMAVVIGLLMVIALWRARTFSDPNSLDQPGKYAEGYWLNKGISLGLVLGMALGLPLGLATDNIAIGVALGPGFGLSLGAAIGSAWERQHQNEIRPLTDSERRARSRAALIGVIALVLGMAAFAIVLPTVLR
jgi:hypothetical protein